MDHGQEAQVRGQDGGVAESPGGAGGAAGDAAAAGQDAAAALPVREAQAGDVARDEFSGGQVLTGVLPSPAVALVQGPGGVHTAIDLRSFSIYTGDDGYQVLACMSCGEDEYYGTTLVVLDDAHPLAELAVRMVEHGAECGS